MLISKRTASVFEAIDSKASGSASDGMSVFDLNELGGAGDVDLCCCAKSRGIGGRCLVFVGVSGLSPPGKGDVGSMPFAI